MTEQEIFNALFNGGNYTLPYLIKFKTSKTDSSSICLINDNLECIYDGETYQPSTFEYNPPNNKGSGGSLTITGLENNLIEYALTINENYQIEVVGVLRGNEVEPVNFYKHCYGSLTINEKETIEFTPTNDDRLEMQFCPYKFDTDNNRANA